MTEPIEGAGGAKGVAGAGTDLRRAARDEASRIQEYSLWNATTYYAAATWLGRVHLVVGSVALVLGAIGAYSGLKEKSPELAGALALVAGILGSLMAFWSPADARTRQLEAASKYKVLENQARRARDLHGSAEDDTEAYKRVSSLAARYDELVEQTAPTSDLAFAAASKRVRKGLYEPEPPARSGSTQAPSKEEAPKS